MRDSYFFGKKLAAGMCHLTGVSGEIGALDVVFYGHVVVNCVAKVDCRRTVFGGCGFCSLAKYFFAEALRARFDVGEII